MLHTEYDTNWKTTWETSLKSCNLIETVKQVTAPWFFCNMCKWGGYSSEQDRTRIPKEQINTSKSWDTCILWKKKTIYCNCIQWLGFAYRLLVIAYRNMQLHEHYSHQCQIPTSPHATFRITNPPQSNHTQSEASWVFIYTIRSRGTITTQQKCTVGKEIQNLNN